jgi:guanylate kinase
MKELEARLRHRNTESEESIRKRLAKAEYEMSFENMFDITLVSEELNRTLQKAEDLVSKFIYQPIN